LLGSNRGGGGLGYQYFTRVQPQRAAARQIRQLDRDVNTLAYQSQVQSQQLAQDPLLAQSQANQAAALAIGPTGHPVGYMSHTQYFGTNLQPARR
jgi:hypothetical protein